MAGIYIHIPFCVQRCSYCDFYKEISSDDKKIDAFVDALLQEIELRKDYLRKEDIATVYFGGGTPSVLKPEHFESIFYLLRSHFTICADAEITMEANPDDLTEAYLKSLSPLPFNRLSIGIQSFNDKRLKALNRRHNAAQAYAAVANARKFGFKNISIDLIYGLPNQDLADWEAQLDAVFELEVEHISAYGLSYEEGTALWKQREKGLVMPVDDDTTIEMFKLMRQKMHEQNFEAYEISNYAKTGFRSKHNSAYWKFVPYLGLGPSAHSFDGLSRQWNVSSIQQYKSGICDQESFFEKEQLTEQDFYNDYVMIALRTSEGIDLDFLCNRFGQDMMYFLMQNAKAHLENKELNIDANHLSLSDTGIHIANIVIMNLMKV